jgi:mono/diheme cytochrome c family protein
VILGLELRSARFAIIVVNVVGFFAIGLYILSRVFPLRRNPEPRDPQNLTPFLEDEDLEGRKLERVLGVALLSVLTIALALAVYYILEPRREASAEKGFKKRSIERGATLFANPQSKAFDNTKSLQCANCHGVDAKGGSAKFTIKSEDPSCDPNAPITEQTPSQCLPVQVAWQAPPLDVVLLRYSRDQVTDIVTYGRPGTPMPSWGIKSGKGVLNEQGVNDLVNYLESITITPKEAQQRFTKQLGSTRADAQKAVDDAQKALADARAKLASASPADQASAQAAVTAAQAKLDNALAQNQHVQSASDGELLFEQQCARCHTKNWSFYDPLNPMGPRPAKQGSGAFGPNLTDGDEVRQFPGAKGPQDQYDWVANGKPAHDPYGIRGISTGRMPHFGRILTKQQIQGIVDYERSL